VIYFQECMVGYVKAIANVVVEWFESNMMIEVDGMWVRGRWV
jgi:hypothetical protein